MELHILAKFDVEILFEDNKNYCSAQNVLNELNEHMGKDVFQIFPAKVGDNVGGYRKLKTKFNFRLSHFTLKQLFDLKENLPSYIVDIYFYDV